MNKVSFQHPYKVVELAAGKVQSNAPGGKRQAIGDIVFTGQPASGDTFTLNGIVFTAMTAGAGANQFNIGASESASIDALVASIATAVTVEIAAIAAAAAALPTSAPTTPPAPYAGLPVVLSGANYSNVGGTKLHIQAAAYGSAGNAYTLAVTSATASVATSVAILNTPTSAADFVFSAQPSDGDKFAINGLEFTFRTVLTVPVPTLPPPVREVLIGAALTNSIDNLVAAIAAAIAAWAAIIALNPYVIPVTAVPVLSNSTYTNVGGTHLHVVATTGSVALLTNSASATLTGTPLTLTSGMDADNFIQYQSYGLDAETKALTTFAGTTVTEWDLLAGEEGQETSFYLAAHGAGSNAQINGAFAGPFTKLTFTAVDQFAKLKFLGGSWKVIANTGALS